MFKVNQLVRLPTSTTSGSTTKSDVEKWWYDLFKSNSNSNKDQDTYNHYTGTSLPSIFYGPDGAIARVIQTGTNDTIVVINFKNGTTEIYYISSDKTKGNTKKFYGPNNSNATIGSDSSGKYNLIITTSDGKTIRYNTDNTYNYENIDDSKGNYMEHNKDTTSEYGSAFTLDKSTAESFDDKSGYDSDLYMLKSEVFPFVATYNPWTKYEKDLKDKNKDNKEKCKTDYPNINNNTQEDSDQSNYSYGRQTFFTYQRPQLYSSTDNGNKPVPAMADFSSFGL